jgi:hypothetical protein
MSEGMNGPRGGGSDGLLGAVRPVPGQGRLWPWFTGLVDGIRIGLLATADPDVEASIAS